MRMTRRMRMRWRETARIAAGVLAAVAVIAVAAHAEEREDTLEKRAPLDGAKRIVVKNARGDIRIVGEQGRDEVRCQYLKRARGRNRDEIDRVFAAMDVAVTRSGDDLVIEAVYPERGEGNRGLLAFIMQQYTSMSVDLDISAPASVAIAVTASSGDVEVAGISGAVEISAASGDIDARRIGASLDVQVSSGDIVAEDVEGPVKLATASGDIDAVRVKKDAAVQSASGDITITAVGGGIVLSSMSGDVSVDGAGSVEFSGTNGNALFTGVRGGVKAGTASGDIEVTASPAGPASFEMTTSSGDIVLVFASALPGGFALKARTTVGDISVRLPIEVHKVGRRYLSGIVGEGKSLVEIETSSGNISISVEE